MAQAKPITQAQSLTNVALSDSSIGLLAFFFIVFFTYIAISQLRSPAPVPASAPLAEFSSARALKQLEVVAIKPHPVGSAAHREVRDYIVSQISALGLTPEIQKTTSVMQRWGFGFQAATVENVFTRLKGTGGGKAVLLVAHYDSVSVGPGANDNGTGIASLLETLRALKEGSPLKNDVMVLLSDAEEIGLLGAKAFTEDHPWAKDIGVVLNYDARGSRGPTIMYETSDGNGWLIGEFAKAAPHPFANSLSQEIYRMMPYGSDMTIFKRAGYPALNFAYIDGANHYHNGLDDLENADERNLQHFGSYALALARHFGNMDLEDKRQNNAVYFDILGSAFVNYSASWAPILAGITTLLFVGVVVLGFKNKQLKVSGIILGFVATLLSLIITPIVVMATWWLIRLVNSNYRVYPQGDVYNSKVYLVAFAALTVAIFATIFLLFRKKAGDGSLAVGAYLWLLIFAVLTSLFVSGASYLLTWPLLFGLVGLAFSFARKEEGSFSIKQLIVLLLTSLAGIVLIVPMIYLIFVALTLANSAPSIVLQVLLLALLVPLVNLMAKPKKWVLPLASVLVFAVFVIIGAMTSGFDSEHPRPNSIFYVMNADSKKAIWVSIDREPDEWTEQYLSKDVKNASIADYIDTPHPSYLQNDAPVLSLAAPELQVVEDRIADGVRSLKLRILSKRQAPVLILNVRAEGETIAATVNGKSNGGKLENQWGFEYLGLPEEGIELGMQVKSTAPIKIRVADQTYGLPEIQGMTFKPRPDSMMPIYFRNSDATLLSRSFTF